MRRHCRCCWATPPAAPRVLRSRAVAPARLHTARDHPSPRRAPPRQLRALFRARACSRRPRRRRSRQRPQSPRPGCTRCRLPRCGLARNSWGARPCRGNASAAGSGPKPRCWRTKSRSSGSGGTRNGAGARRRSDWRRSGCSASGASLRTATRGSGPPPSHQMPRPGARSPRAAAQPESRPPAPRGAGAGAACGQLLGVTTVAAVRRGLLLPFLALSLRSLLLASLRLQPGISLLQLPPFPRLCLLELALGRRARPVAVVHDAAPAHALLRLHEQQGQAGSGLEKLHRNAVAAGRGHLLRVLHLRLGGPSPAAEDEVCYVLAAAKLREPRRPHELRDAPLDTCRPSPHEEVPKVDRLGLGIVVEEGGPATLSLVEAGHVNCREKTSQHLGRELLHGGLGLSAKAVEHLQRRDRVVPWATAGPFLRRADIPPERKALDLEGQGWALRQLDKLHPCGHLSCGEDDHVRNVEGPCHSNEVLQPVHL
mmetsp:Transcript_24750/g.71226  ORF Transcript_24750/g.71226 Transcript_24750/m.71226 type:complete len:483 (+) Transcript_24750:341-1789(+)